jgi:hypothetical protein
VQAGTAALPAITTTGDTNTGIFFPADDTVGVTTGGSERTRVDSSGNLLVGVTSANANGGVLQLKSGITFPATQVAATDANTLDDYEEGTWTPAQGSGLTVVGAFSSAGRYTKIGRVVTISGSVTTFIITSNTLAYFALQNLPFTDASLAVGALWNDTRNTSGTTLVNGNVFYGFLSAASGTTSGSAMTLRFSNTYTV